MARDLTTACAFPAGVSPPYHRTVIHRGSVVKSPLNRPFPAHHPLYWCTRLRIDHGQMRNSDVCKSLFFNEWIREYCRTSDSGSTCCGSSSRRTKHVLITDAFAISPSKPVAVHLRRSVHP
jgi:hypothetical protein